MRLRAVLVLLVAVVAACSAVPVGAPSTTTTVLPPTTTTTIPADPWSLRVGEVAMPAPPVGSGPSFTESAGCDAPQGIRGPYAIRAGFLDDETPIWGPWADFFGRDVGEVRAHLVRMELPNGDDPPVPVYVDERAVPALQMVIDTLNAEAERGNVYHLDPSQVSSFWPRTIPPKRYMSFHAIGIAIDINSLTNEYREDNVLVTDIPNWFVKAWTDAGWCWGGHWQDIKDAMHFSWKGPRYTPGYEAVAPMPVRTEAAGFERTFEFRTALGAPRVGTDALIADVDRDGAVDVVHVGAALGGLTVTAAVAIHGYFSCWPTGFTSNPPPPGSTPIMADVDGDARPDLVLVGPDDGFVSAVGYTHASGYAEHLPVVRTGVPALAGARYLLADHDRDTIADLWVIDPGDPGALSIWAGPDFGRRLMTIRLPMTVDDSWRFAVGDRDGDGTMDLLALGPEALLAFDGSRAFAASPESLITPATGRPGTLQTGDFDGDGRVDLYVLDGDGRVAVYLGGDRAGVGDEALMSWFLEGGDQPWEAWEGCPFAAYGLR